MSTTKTNDNIIVTSSLSVKTALIDHQYEILIKDILKQQQQQNCNSSNNSDSQKEETIAVAASLIEIAKSAKLLQPRRGTFSSENFINKSIPFRSSYNNYRTIHNYVSAGTYLPYWDHDADFFANVETVLRTDDLFSHRAELVVMLDHIFNRECEHCNIFEPWVHGIAIYDDDNDNDSTSLVLYSKNARYDEKNSSSSRNNVRVYLMRNFLQNFYSSLVKK